MAASRTLVGLLCGVAAGALWGTVFVAPNVVADFSASALSFARYLLYGCLSSFLLLGRWRRVAGSLSLKSWLKLGALAAVGNLGYYVLLATGVHLGGVATTSLVIGFLPAAVTVFGARGNGSLPLVKLVPSILLCGAGALTIGWQALAASATTSWDDRLAGLLCGVGALGAWTWYAIWNSRWLAEHPALSALDWNLVAGVATGVVSLLLVPAVLGEFNAGYDPAAWLRLGVTGVVLALLASVGGNALWNRAGQLLPMTLAGNLIHFETLFALAYGFAWERRWPSMFEALSFVLVASSVVTCLVAHNRWADATTCPTSCPAKREVGPHVRAQANA